MCETTPRVRCFCDSSSQKSSRGPGTSTAWCWRVGRRWERPVSCDRAPATRRAARPDPRSSPRSSLGMLSRTTSKGISFVWLPATFISVAWTSFLPLSDSGTASSVGRSIGDALVSRRAAQTGTVRAEAAGSEPPSRHRSVFAGDPGPRLRGARGRAARRGERRQFPGLRGGEPVPRVECWGVSAACRAQSA